MDIEAVHTHEVASGDRSPTAPPSVDAMVDATPADRDRVVDLIRGLSIGVVVLWHWTLSVTDWSGGSLSMPNPIGEASGLWLLTWIFQVMPLFFVVGGFSNLAGWTSMLERRAVDPGRDRRPGRSFVWSRAKRLGLPAGAMLGTWVLLDVAIRLVRPGTPSVFSWGIVVFVPLWFLGVYGIVTSLVPLTARLHATAPTTTLTGMIAIIALADTVRFGAGVHAAGYVTTAGVWLFAHQLGYWWRDGTLDSAGRDSHVALTVLGMVGLVVTTNTGIYPRSTVAVEGEWLSNMFPTTAPIACLAVFQLGLVFLVRPAANRWLARSRRAWRTVVTVNAVAMTVFCWHMTALVAAIAVWNLLGFDLIGDPT
ncbi:MAG: acyltransferase, partial [Ilumatobacter sp.]